MSQESFQHSCNIKEGDKVELTINGVSVASFLVREEFEGTAHLSVSVQQ